MNSWIIYSNLNSEFYNLSFTTCFLVALFSRQVAGLVFIPGRDQQRPLSALMAGDAVFLLDHQGALQTLHSVYGHPVTCLDASHALLAFGVKRSGWTEHDGGNQVGRPLKVRGQQPGVGSAPPYTSGSPVKLRGFSKVLISNSNLLYKLYC